MKRTLPLLWAALALVTALPAETPHPPLGKLTPVTDACPAGPVASTTCHRYEVACPEIKPIQVSVRVTEPAAGVPFRGTVVMGSGGTGASFYSGDAAGQELVTAIAAMGFRVVDRSWAGGWPTAEGGLRKESCRYATLLTWVHDNLHKGGKFIATGNSGGSAEISYALTTWGRGDILDVAIPTSGPPLGRLDYVCVREPSPEWSALCASIIPKGVMECASGCMLGPQNAVCKQVTATPTLQQLRDDSVVHPDAVLNYPHTKVFFLYGAHDCGEPVPNGLTYATKITSEKSIEFVPKTPHALFSTPEGRAAIRKAIAAGAGIPQP